MPPGGAIRFAWYGALVYEFAGTILAGAAIGWFLDRSLGTQPYLAVVLTLLGVVGGFVLLVQRLRRLDREREP